MLWFGLAFRDWGCKVCFESSGLDLNFKIRIEIYRFGSFFVLSVLACIEILKTGMAFIDLARIFSFGRQALD